MLGPNYHRAAWLWAFSCIPGVLRSVPSSQRSARGSRAEQSSNGAPLSPDSGLEVLAVQRVSKTQAWQRTGRAGREDSGVCYRLYTEDEFEKFEKMTVPEIQR